MRIAVPTNDDTHISDHFGRAAAFLVFDVEDGRIAACHRRENTACHPHDHEHGASAPHNHDGIVSALAGCDVVLAGGMGWRAAEALKAANIQTVLAPGALVASDAVAAYLNGALPAAPTTFCRCSH